MRKVNYDRFPSTKITGTILQGWDAVHTLLVECFKVMITPTDPGIQAAVRAHMAVVFLCN